MAAELLFSIKRRQDLFWRTHLSQDRIVAELESQRISRDWLICPLGQASRAITIDEFLDDPRNPGPALETSKSERVEPATFAPIVPVFYVACIFNLMLSTLLTATSDSIAAVAMAAIMVQIGLLSAWVGLSSWTYLVRLLVGGAIGLVLFVCFAFGATLMDVDAALLILSICPSVFFATQLPYLVTRNLFGYVLEKHGQVVGGSYSRAMSIRDIIFGTTVVGISVALLRVASLILDDSVPNGLLVVYSMGTAMFCSALVFPLVFWLLVARRDTVALTGILVAYSLLVGTAMGTIVVTESYALVIDAWLAPAVLLLSCGFVLFMVRQWGFRLVRSGRGRASTLR